MDDDYEAEPRRRRRIRLPRSYEVFRLTTSVVVGAVGWGVILGDIWLWRLLHG